MWYTYYSLDQLISWADETLYERVLTMSANRSTLSYPSMLSAVIIEEGFKSLSEASRLNDNLAYPTPALSRDRRS